MEENKTVIVARLSQLLKATRAGEDIARLKLSEDESEVTIIFTSGYVRDVNVECDSGMALIRDVIRNL